MIYFTLFKASDSLVAHSLLLVGQFLRVKIYATGLFLKNVTGKLYTIFVLGAIVCVYFIKNIFRILRVSEQVANDKKPFVSF